MFRDPFRHEAVCFQIDETGAVGEFADEYFVYAGELLAGVVGAGDGVTDVCVASEVPVEGVEEESVVVLAGGDGGLVEGAGVERDPRTVGDALDAVGDDQMGVELRVSGAGFPMVEGGGNGAHRAEVGDAVPAGARVDDVLFEPGQGLLRPRRGGFAGFGPGCCGG